MTNKTDFVKIRVHILIDPSKHFIYEDGNMKWNIDYLEEFYDADAKFRDPIMGFINDEVGTHNWAIRFQPFYTGEYEVYIYCDNESDYHKIITIIQDKLKDEDFRLFAMKGTVDDYIAGR